MSMELYKKHRPRTLEKVLGASSTTAALDNMLKKGTLPHTILMTGPSGCGKTTIARILKKRLACHDMDFKEINCADSTGIDTIREIARLMPLSPTGGKVRVWLLDEVHMLSTAAQNAALKIFEDTPDHVYFFLCTTDPQKLIKTINTRCCKMPVYDLTYDDLIALMERVLAREKKKLSDEVIEEIAGSAQGSARTALVLLDKIINLEEKDQLKAIAQKLAEDNEAIDLCRALLAKKPVWQTVGKILQNLKGEPESTRYSVLMYARKVLLDNGSHEAYSIICAFENNFYDSKKAGLARACYEAIFSD